MRIRRSSDEGLKVAAKCIPMRNYGLFAFEWVAPVTLAFFLAWLWTATLKKERRTETLSRMRAKLFGETRLSEKMKLITACLNDLFVKAAFRIWMIDIGENNTATNSNPGNDAPSVLKTIDNVCLRLIAGSVYPSSLGPDENWDAHEDRLLGELLAPATVQGQNGDLKKEGDATDSHASGYRILSQTGSPIGAFLFTSQDPVSTPQRNLLSSIVQDVTHVFRDARVRSMALIHETLHQTNDLSVVELKGYVRKLIRDLISVYNSNCDQFAIDYDLDDIALELNQAVYCGLIVNELVTNALNHAFVGKERGNIHISAKRVGDDEIQLSVKDDGVGLPPELDRHKATI